MIVSHKYQFIFVKTRKTAGTSLEVFLSQCCADSDIFTPIDPPVEPHRPRNYRGRFNPFPELLSRSRGWQMTVEDWQKKNRFWCHTPAHLIRERLPRRVWNGYFKFCIERNPWDKTISHYFWLKHRLGGKLTWDEYFARGEFCPNIRWYTDRNGRVIVDRVLKYENLQAELQEVFDRLGIPYGGDLGVQAKSGHRTDRRPYSEMFSEEQRRTIAAVCADEIALHGYEFGR